MNHNHEAEPDVLAETEQFAIWRSLEDDDVYMYHVELGGSLTLHLTPEEWEEFVLLVRNASAE
ncbi:hypothetical protein [Promineifilum sp.]|uniref:hypothetical protein n=1 Tax=Promineifilum sp. TaxID=2664178 RepID=UPI0035B4EE66